MPTAVCECRFKMYLEPSDLQPIAMTNSCVMQNGVSHLWMLLFSVDIYHTIPQCILIQFVIVFNIINHPSGPSALGCIVEMPSELQGCEYK